MNLIVLYGPPGSGKFTLAKRLSENYSYTLLHNHSIYELTNSSLNKESDSYWGFCWKLHEMIVLEGIKENIRGMVMTRAGTGSENEHDFFSKTKQFVQESGGSMIIIKLSCTVETLKNRVKEDSRKQFTKVQDESSLMRWFERYNDRIILLEEDEIIVENNTANIDQTKNIIIEQLLKKGISSE